jgi:hypothetical protein
MSWRTIAELIDRVRIASERVVAAKDVDPDEFASIVQSRAHVLYDLIYAHCGDEYSYDAKLSYLIEYAQKNPKAPPNMIRIAAAKWELELAEKARFERDPTDKEGRLDSQPLDDDYMSEDQLKDMLSHVDNGNRDDQWLG